MFELVDVSGLDAASALDLVEVADRARRLAEAQRALAMLRVVRLYRHDIPGCKVQLGAAGTPLIDDFACLELAAALRRDRLGVTVEVAELLTLEARHPLLWEQVTAGQAQLWLARKIARAAWKLPSERARWLDATVAPFISRLGPSRMLRFVDALVVQADPNAAIAAGEVARSARKVRVGQSEDGVAAVYGLLDAADAIYLDAALAQLSDILAGQGVTDSADVRRATALGILATPARALSLIQGALQPALGFESGSDPSMAAADASLGKVSDGDSGLAGRRGPLGCQGHTCGSITVEPDRLLPKATLVVHVAAETLASGDGLARAERVGPVTIEQLQVLLHNTRVTIQPVLDTAGIAPVDCYEIPRKTRRAVLVRQPWEVFPYSSRSSRHLDLDHTAPYRWDGTIGQTRVDNLGPLSRKVHRAKTHAGWRLDQPAAGEYHWVSPLGRQYAVTPDGLSQAIVPVSERFRSAPAPAVRRSGPRAGARTSTRPKRAGSPLLPAPPLARPRTSPGPRVRTRAATIGYAMRC